MLNRFLKARLKSKYFFSDAEIDNMSTVMSYVVPVYSFLQDVQKHHPVELLTNASKCIELYFDVYRVAKYTRTEDSFCLQLSGIESKGYIGVEIVVRKSLLYLYGLRDNDNFGVTRHTLEIK